MVSKHIIALAILFVCVCATKQPQDNSEVKVKYLVFREDCFDKFFVDFNFLDVDCIKYVRYHCDVF